MTTANERRTGWILRLVGIAAAVILPYLPVWGQLGLYWDDFLLLSIGEVRGAAGMMLGMSQDRPLLGLGFIGLWQLVGTDIWTYHLVMMGLRIALAVAVSVLTDQLWNGQLTPGTLAGFLTAAYPGFQQYATAYIYAMTLLVLLLYTVSLAATLAALRADSGRRVALQLLSVLTALPAVGMIEYYATLEVLRLLLVALHQRTTVTGDWRALVRATALPLCSVGLLVAWRLLFFESTRTVTDADVTVLAPLMEDPLRWLLSTASRILPAPLLAAGAWIIVPWRLVTEQDWQPLLPWLVPLLVLLPMAAVHLLRRTAPPAAQGPSLRAAVLLLGVAMLFTVVPVAAVGREILLLHKFDRYVLPLLPALALLLSLLLVRLPQRILISLAAGLMVVGGLSQALAFQQYAADWGRNRVLWQQLTVRKPTLDAGTTLLLDRRADHRSIVNQGHYTIWGPANQVYRSADDWAIGGQLIQTSSLDLVNARFGSRLVREQLINGQAERALIVVQPERGCVRVITPALWRLPPELSNRAMRVVESRFSTDWPQPDGPAVQLAAELPAWLGRADATSWCGLLQQAELAEELGDEAALARVTETVLAGGLQPDEPHEWRVYAEYLLRAGRTAEAEQLLQAMIDGSAETAPVCTWWQAVGGAASCRRGDGG